jgi:hypothetical protein
VRGASARRQQPRADPVLLQMGKQINQHEQAGRNTEQPCNQILRHLHSPVIGAGAGARTLGSKLQYPGQGVLRGLTTVVDASYALKFPHFARHCFEIERM